MLLRRTAPFALALAAIACEPSVPSGTNPTQVDYAAFDPTGNPPAIPLPNDLALQASAIASQPGAAGELLTAFAKQGGFPNDQDVPITVDFVRESIGSATGAITRSAPPLDVTSITTSNLVITNLGTTEAYDPPTAADYVTNGDHGTLTLHRSFHHLDPTDPKSSLSRRWDAGGIYIVAVRGGANGVKTTDHGTFNPQPTMYLLLQDQSFLDPQNQGLLPGTTAAEKQAVAKQLEMLRVGYQLPFGLIDAHFSHHEIAVMSTFHIAPAATHVETDPEAGLMPLPSDFLLGPDGHLVSQLTAPTGPFGPLGPGLSTLDGFSTTAIITAGISSPIDASTVSGSVFVYELSATGATRLYELADLAAGKSPTFIFEPPAITQLVPRTTIHASTIIGLQPAVPVPVPGVGLVTLPPLKEATEYAVVITNGVKDINQKPLVSSTLGKLLLFTNPLVDASGHSQVPGVPDAQAAALEPMHRAISGVVQQLSADTSGTITKDKVVMAYTFKTQSITGIALQLGALPYAPACSATVTSNCLPVAAFAALSVPFPKAAGGGTLVEAPATAFANYGVDTNTVPGTGAGDHIDSIIETVMITLNNLDPATGAFNSDISKAQAEGVPVILSVPKIANAIAAGYCPGLPTIPCAVPLVVFHHGFSDSRTSMLTVADRFAAQGMIVAAIDEAKHGLRSYCASDDDCLAAVGATCAHDPALAHQGDPAGNTPGKCVGPTGAPAPGPTNGFYFANAPTLCPPTGCTAPPGSGSPKASANFLISGNLFRTRDTFRQDIIDQSQLIHMLAVNPLAPPPTQGDSQADSPAHCAAAPLTAAPNASCLFTSLADKGFVIDPRKVTFLGQSLGAFNGTVDAAVNPRISNVVLNVGGETFVDTFANSPAFADRVARLLASIGITDKKSPAYLQFLLVAKWVLDPAEPANFAHHLAANTLPNLLKGGLPPPFDVDPMRPKAVLGQLANCDATVPNAFNLLLYGNIGLGTAALPGSAQELFTYPSHDGVGDCAGGPVPHAFLTDWGIANGVVDPNLAAATQQVQDDAAVFLSTNTAPPAIRNVGP